MTSIVSVAARQPGRSLHVTVDRLPRLLTDQTASVTETIKLASPIACLMPMVREAQSWPRRTP
jgi:hypothetical protein